MVTGWPLLLSRGAAPIAQTKGCTILRATRTQTVSSTYPGRASSDFSSGATRDVSNRGVLRIPEVRRRTQSEEGRSSWPGSGRVPRPLHSRGAALRDRAACGGAGQHGNSVRFREGRAGRRHSRRDGDAHQRYAGHEVGARRDQRDRRLRISRTFLPTPTPSRSRCRRSRR